MIYFEANKDFNATYFRIPFCEITNEDVLIVGGDVRYNGSSDVGNIDIGIARSLDFGESFMDKKVVIKNHRIVEHSRMIDACILVDRTTNRVFLFAHCIDSNNLWEQTADPADIDAYMVYSYSDDNGETWSEPSSLADLKDSTMVSLFPGPGKGITMGDGTLVVPCQIKTDETNGLPSIQSCIIISKNHGQTWEFKGGRVPEFSSECQVVQLEDGSLMLNCRSYAGYRRVFISEDLGTTWTPHETNCNTLIEPYACQASLDKVVLGNGDMRYVFCNPDSAVARENITLKISSDTIQWEKKAVLVEGHTDGYTCVCHKEDMIYIAVERHGDLELYKVSAKRL